MEERDLPQHFSTQFLIPAAEQVGQFLMEDLPLLRPVMD